MKISLNCLTIIILLVNCSRTEDDTITTMMERNINRKLHLDMIDSVEIRTNKISLNDFQAMYKFLSIVYLQDGCGPCYPKYIDWHLKMNDLPTNTDYTVLFIINANKYSVFKEDSHKIGLVKDKYYYFVEDKYYHFMDPTNSFIRKNTHIPKSIIELSLLIDYKNRIKLIGAPYATEDMTKVFHIITGTKE